VVDIGYQLEIQINMKEMKNILLGLLFILVTINSNSQVSPIIISQQSTIYYVDNVSGNDSYTGKSPAKAWRTLAKVRSSMGSFVPGVLIALKRGQVFNDSIVFNVSGTFKKPITFTAYGIGNNPIISGFTTVSGWTNVGTNLWESSTSVSSLSYCNMVIINGVNTHMGTFPNDTVTSSGYTGFMYYQTHVGNTSLTTSSLSGTPDFTGGEVVFRAQYTLDRRTILTQSGGTLTVIGDLTLSNNSPIFIQNNINTLDRQNEWYYNPSTKKITVYSVGQPSNVKVAAINRLFVFAKQGGSNYSLANYITIKNITFEGANTSAVYGFISLAVGHKLTGIRITNCTIQNCGTDAISFDQPESAYISNNYINGSNGRGIGLAYAHNTYVGNNTIANININKGMAIGWGAYSAIDLPGSVHTTTEYNRITNCGYDGINFSFTGTDSCLIQYNYLDSFCMVLGDGGGIYGNNRANIHHNIVLDGGIGGKKLGINDPWAVGIYLDDNSYNNTVSFNTVYNCSRVGIYLHNTRLSTITNNNSFNNLMWQIYINDDATGGADVASNNINNNQFIAKTNTQEEGYYQSYANNLLTFGTFDYNIYTRPISETGVLRTYEPLTGTVMRTISSWQTFFSQESHSANATQTLTTINDFQFEFNPTKVNKVVTLTQPMIDVKGVKYTGTVTLLPYTSIVLMKDANP